MQREKRTKSGPLLEVDFYPVFSDGRRLPTRAPKAKPTTAEMIRYNRLVATKKLIRLVNTNFDDTDYLMHPTYRPELAPQSEEEARRDLVNYLRRVKTRRAADSKKIRRELGEAREALARTPESGFLQDAERRLVERLAKLEQPFRYIYVIEKQTYKTGQFAGRANWHFHLFLTGGIAERDLEKMWKNGLRTNCNHFQPEEFGPEAAANYMAKDPQGAKRFCYSRNLEQPKQKVKDGKISRLGVERLAALRVDDAKYWERRYKGYRFLRCYNRYNPFNGHWYVSVVMYKTNGDPPKWEEEEWIT